MTTSVPSANLRLKRAYEPAEPGDGVRILVDRLWPRGVSKEEAALDDWMKDIAPSTELRQWFGHDPGRWRNSSAAIGRNCGNMARISTASAIWPQRRRSLSSMPPVTRSITTLSCCGTYCWDERAMGGMMRRFKFSRNGCASRAILPG